MSHRFMIAALALFVAASPLAAQEQPAPPVPPDTLAPAPTPPDTAAPAPVAAPDTAAPAAPSHDWEFGLAATDRAPGASGNVLVTEGDPSNTFAVVVTGLPVVDSLDEEGRDVDVYTVWVVPSKERVQESTLAGTLAVDDAGAGRFEGSTELDSFGVIVLASDDQPTTLSGVPVLTGIPVGAPTPAETPPGEAAPTPQPTGETPAPEEPEPQPPAPEPEEREPELR